MEGDSTSTTSASSLKPKTMKSRYSSPLSSFRNNYKPPADSSGFKPTMFSSPKSKEGLGPAVQAIKEKDSTNPEPATRPTQVSVGQQSPTSNDSNPITNRSNNFVSNSSLEGRGGEWRGPHQNNMQPEERNNRPFFRQNNGSPYSPRGKNFQNRGSPHDMIDNLNFRNANRNNSFGHSNSPGNNSFRQNNSYGQHNSSNNAFSPHNSTNDSFNYSNNQRGNNSNRNQDSSTDMSMYYHHSMMEDPWAELVQEKLRNAKRKAENPVRNTDSD